MTARLTAEERVPHGPFTVRRRGDEIIVLCARCRVLGQPRTWQGSPRSARRLARHLNGPFGRFVVRSTRARRLALAAALLALASSTTPGSAPSASTRSPRRKAQ